MGSSLSWASRSAPSSPVRAAGMMRPLLPAARVTTPLMQVAPPASAARPGVRGLPWRPRGAPPVRPRKLISALLLRNTSIRRRVGEDPRTLDVPRLNVEVNDGVADIRGEVHSEEEKQAVEEIASSVEGVTEVRNLITVNTDAPSRRGKTAGGDTH